MLFSLLVYYGMIRSMALARWGSGAGELGYTPSPLEFQSWTGKENITTISLKFCVIFLNFSGSLLSPLRFSIFLFELYQAYKQKCKNFSLAITLFPCKLSGYGLVSKLIVNLKIVQWTISIYFKLILEKSFKISCKNALLWIWILGFKC